MWVHKDILERAIEQSHELRVEQLLLASYLEQKKSRELLQRNEFLMELMSERLNHIEWRQWLGFESKWSGKSLQAAFKAWKHGAGSVPSREGEDRRGYAGSPMDSVDEQRADEELPDEEMWAKVASMPEWIYDQKQELEDKRAHRRYWKARVARAEAACQEKRAHGELNKEQKRALKGEFFWQRERRESTSLSSIDEQEQPNEAAAEQEAEQAGAAAEPAAGAAAETAAAAAAEPGEQQAAGSWVKVEL